MSPATAVSVAGVAVTDAVEALWGKLAARGRRSIARIIQIARSVGPERLGQQRGGFFAHLHLHLPGLPLYVLHGLAPAWLTERTGSIVPSITAHAVVNACALAATLLAAS
jgi:hypothetical protein